MQRKLTGHITIRSLHTEMVALIRPQEFVVWRKGNHIAYVYKHNNPNPADTFEFGRVGANKITQLDFTLALETYYLCQDPRRVY